MVVSASSHASEIGAALLKNGGNAVDAAVAVGFALAVLFPEAGNLGGGGFMLIRMKGGESVFIDFREKAPEHSWRDMYVDSGGKVTLDATRGVLSAGVPGTVGGLLYALKKYGRLKASDVLDPAVMAAKNGFIVDERLGRRLREYREELAKYPSTKKIFFKDDNPLAPGDTLFQDDLAETLARIREYGEDDFYAGKTSRLMIEQMKRDGGLITERDLKLYRPVERPPVRGTYRGHEIISAPPPSSGGICLIEMLNMLERYDIGKMGYHSAGSVHVISEAMKRVFADRSEYLGDPDFVKIPVDSLISKEYALRLAAGIDTAISIPSIRLKPGLETPEDPNTTHYSVVDPEGNCVAVTYTINDYFGSQVIVDGAGFFLNNEMDDFSSKPGTGNSYGLIGGYANSIHPYKRPLSSMTPTIVLKDGKPLMVLGARGGSRIITAVAQAIINVIDYRFQIKEAVAEPRFHHQWMPDELRFEKQAFNPDVLLRLSSMGHRCGETVSPLGALEAIYLEDGLIHGAPDYREGGTAAGY